MAHPAKTVLTLAEVAEYLRLPTSTIYKLTREGALPAQKIGKQWRFSLAAIDKWLEGADATIGKDNPQANPGEKE